MWVDPDDNALALMAERIGSPLRNGRVSERSPGHAQVGDDEAPSAKVRDREPVELVPDERDVRRLVQDDPVGILGHDLDVPAVG